MAQPVHRCPDCGSPAVDAIYPGLCPACLMALAVNAIHMTPIPSFDYALLYHERTIRSVANCTRRDAEEFLALAAEIPVHADIERYPLEEANEALLRVKRGEVHGAAVLQVRR